ncbi:MAG TPA: hypothetical protein VM324_03315 [Egibacteraceae bacterium]|jgi:hypothetical protein|nr:hypothetical protein [Egibacteraceae bacterium]
MSRRFRYYAVLEGIAEAEDEGPLLIRVETGQDYDTYQSVHEGQWVQDNAAYDYVHGTGAARACEAAEAHQLIAERYGTEQADRLVPGVSA